MSESETGSGERHADEARDLTREIGQAAVQTQVAKVRLEAERMAEAGARERLTALEELQAELAAGRETAAQAEAVRRSRLAVEYQTMQRVVQIVGRRTLIVLALLVLVSGLLLGGLLAGRWARSVGGAGLEAAPLLYSPEGESERLAHIVPNLQLESDSEAFLEGSHGAMATTDGAVNVAENATENASEGKAGHSEPGVLGDSGDPDTTTAYATPTAPGLPAAGDE
ncbi:MAG: hypothetical protein KBF29_07285 [Sterolibacterium sp.]|nr:hypothetical protein [Sterolibacterium sp.]